MSRPGSPAGPSKTESAPPLKKRASLIPHALFGPAFSISGSWFDISPVISEHVRAENLHLVSHQTGLHPVLCLMPVAGEDRAETTWQVSPAQLSWIAESAGRVDLA